MDYDGAEKHILGLLREQLPESYCFHDWTHTRDVIEFAVRIAGWEGVAGEPLLLLKTAALCHDTGYLRRYADNERLGVEYAEQILPRFGYPAAALTTVDGLIMATAMPQRPETGLQKIICDADMFYLTTEAFWLRAECLRRELAAQGRIYDDRQWYELEKKFLTEKHFFTGECETRYQRVLPEMLNKLNGMHAGVI